MANRSYLGALGAHSRLKKHYGEMKKDPKNYDKAFIRESYHSRCVQLVRNTGKPLSPQQKEKIYDDVIRAFY